MFSMVGVVKQAHASDLTFAPAVDLSSDQFDSEIPLLATAGSNLYAVWLNNTAGNTDILFRASTNDGGSWTPALGTPAFKVSNRATNGASSNPEVAAAGSNVYVVWQDNSTGNAEVWFRASINSGGSFGSPVNLSGETRDSTEPQIAVSGTNVYVTWQNEVSGPSGSIDIFFRASSNGGATWSPAIASAATNLSNDKSSTEPVIAAVGSNVYVAWRDTNIGKNDIFFRASSNGGSSWVPALGSAPVNLSQNPSSPTTTSFQGKILATGSNVYVLWTKDTPTTDDIFFTASTNNGGSFTTPSVNLSNNAGSIFPQASATGNSVHVVWEDHSQGGGTQVAYRVSTNNGGTFNSAVSLGSSIGAALLPQVASIGTNVYVTWQDPSGNNDVVFRSSSDTGGTFGTTVNLSNNGGFSTSPVVAAGVNAYVAWEDDTPGNLDIFFRTGNIKTTFKLNAFSLGWNSTNPSLTVFRGKVFTVMVIWKDSSTHVFALYSKGFLATSVFPSDSCSLGNTNGCLARSPDVTSSNPSTVFAFTVPSNYPADDFTGPGGYEYYCQYHPTTMHGSLLVLKTPDFDGDGKVTIVDAATLAFAYDSTPANPLTWNVAVDLDNDGRVTILDAAQMAFYYDQTI